MRYPFVFAAFVLALLLTGCYFQNPLTGPSRDIDTWFLGVWEGKGKSGKVTRAEVFPASGDRYFIRASVPAKSGNGTNRYEFEAWASRVGEAKFLSMRCTATTGEVPLGAWVFVFPQMLDQNRLRLRGLDLSSPSNAGSMALRREVRERWNDQTLFGRAPSIDLRRVAEVYWSRDGQTGEFRPIRNPIP